MKQIAVILFLLASLFSFETDSFATSAGNVEITFVGHASLIIRHNKKTIHVDPYSALANYLELPKADIILITHHHRDHLDTNALQKISTKNTKVFTSAIVAKTLQSGTISFKSVSILTNESFSKESGYDINTIAAYNLVHKRETGDFYHIRGEGNGYVITIGKTRFYIAGDTENIPEMTKLKNIDVAFLPMNVPFTMTPKMVADAALSFMPKVLYPYHFGKTDPNELVELLKDQKQIEVRIRNMGR